MTCWTAQGTLLSVTWQPGWEGSLGQTGYVCKCGWVPLLSAWDYHRWSSAMKKSESVSRSLVTDSLRPRGLQPTRLLCPWDSPMPSSRGSSWPRGRTGVSSFAGRFFTVWAAISEHKIESSFFKEAISPWCLDVLLKLVPWEHNSLPHTLDLERQFKWLCRMADIQTFAGRQHSLA